MSEFSHVCGGSIAHNSGLHVDAEPGAPARDGIRAGHPIRALSGNVPLTHRYNHRGMAMSVRRIVVSATLATAALLAGTAAPALAAYPVSGFPALRSAYGGANLTVTWYGRSIGVDYSIKDIGGDGYETWLCVTGTNNPITFSNEKCVKANSQAYSGSFDVNPPSWVQRGSFMDAIATLYRVKDGYMTFLASAHRSRP
ncbi:hypothetical protein [Actinoplanes utahensis]|uniref:hypothetical protein n=1 Tax=Actinoplanes utahensis TaxID=1869 RepID=UPI00126A5672|nr:hypothetical protein [Actinoplanes utahensis]GIF31637.1 hypothetical protein Aut01nite_46230 [Actinoplanes utahensis]